uniref:Proteoglycan 4a n=1 Tax=Dicentrarchus labrax TaxID=13489 RepID=A0A8C4DEW4_DICLA
MSLVCLILSCNTPNSCVGRCGETFTRGQQCTCDLSCLLHNECCQDFQAICTTAQSCQGRCGEGFQRGQLCECDPQCIHYNTCCHDYQLHCGKGHNNTVIHTYTHTAPLDSPINGLTALSNGTILIFKGDLFWSVDPVSRSVGRPQSITDTLGVSSPIDTVFTRCNCHGNTYIIKGDQYWRLDGNMVMEPGYPKPLVSEFPGLTGSISAALPVPATRSRPETVYFFKNGDIMQRFTFPSGSVPPCSKTSRSSFQKRFARQAEVLLSGEINIKVSLKGFPTPVTSALSMPSLQTGDRYEHYVFSGRKNHPVHSLFSHYRTIGLEAERSCVICSLPC